jgi:hypothetical protein
MPAVSSPRPRIDKIRKEPHHGKAVEMAVEAIMDLLQATDDSGNRPDVALIALPVSFCSMLPPGGKSTFDGDIYDLGNLSS